MNKDVIKAAVSEFIKDGKPSAEFSFSHPGNPLEIFTVKFERKRAIIANESMKFEARANTISALPSGEKCSCCNGSGRS